MFNTFFIITILLSSTISLAADNENNLTVNPIRLEKSYDMKSDLVNHLIAQIDKSNELDREDFEYEEFSMNKSFNIHRGYDENYVRNYISNNCNNYNGSALYTSFTKSYPYYSEISRYVGTPGWGGYKDTKNELHIDARITCIKVYYKEELLRFNKNPRKNLKSL